ncbi:MAG: hypothetical protein ACRDO2_09625, partial [Nocardioidaceae bacterium]
GTTYLQNVFWRNRTALTEAGVYVPLASPVKHFHAALDLRQMPFNGWENPAVPGTWEKLVTATRSAPTERVLISHELFAGAKADEVGRLVDALAPANVHVVYGARDLARQLPAVWQESVKNKSGQRFGDFLDRIVGQCDAGDIEKAGFWRGQHAVAALRRWGTHIPSERIHVVTLPQSGAPPTTLWERFCSVLGLDPAEYDLDVGRTNPSLSAEETEVLRLVNRALPEDVTWPIYDRRIKRRFNRRADAGSPGSRLRVPVRYRDRIAEFTVEIKEGLAAAGYGIVGDLDDLDPTDAVFDQAAPVKDAEVATAAARMLAELLMEVAPVSPARSPDGHPGGSRVRELAGKVVRRVRRS